jgi:hypothetical protein
MRGLLSIILGCAVIFAMVGCAPADNSVHVNAENSDNLTNDRIGKSALIEIGDYLWYDSSTRIVYWYNGQLHSGYHCMAPSPYYAPNGLPYRYNPETNTFEEITREYYVESTDAGNK